MTSTCYPGRVKCRGRGLTFGYFGQPIVSKIDTRMAGRGELTVFCAGPSPDRPAFCELREREESDGEGSGVFLLIVRPQDCGLHHLCIRYNRRNVTGSPFPLRVSSAGLLRFSGPGLQDGVIGQLLPHFTIDTENAGRGDVKVKIGGPKGAFRMRTLVSGKKIHCSYSVSVPGEYVIQVLWCGDQVPDSPFRIHVSRTLKELFIHQQRTINKGHRSTSTATAAAAAAAAAAANRKHSDRRK